MIFFCVVAKVPLMRNPIQILFLILVTDLPPSIALGMEPGEPNILDNRPRPKDEPIVLVWMWYSVCANGIFLALVITGVYLLALNKFCPSNLEFMADAYCTGKPNKQKLMNARTCAFISLVFSENIRAYTSRSFNKPVWVKLCANRVMLVAVVIAQVMMWAAVFIPGLSDTILKLDGTFDWVWDDLFWGWGVAMLGPIGCVVCCETFKFVTAYQMDQYQIKLRKHQEAEEAHRQQALTLEIVRKNSEGQIKQNLALMAKLEEQNLKLSDAQGKIDDLTDQIVKVESKHLDSAKAASEQVAL
jgi:magnesium-transporting ATPase (P-type)